MNQPIKIRQIRKTLETSVINRPMSPPSFSFLMILEQIKKESVVCAVAFVTEFILQSRTLSVRPSV